MRKLIVGAASAVVIVAATTACGTATTTTVIKPPPTPAVAKTTAARPTPAATKTVTTTAPPAAAPAVTKTVTPAAAPPPAQPAAAATPAASTPQYTNAEAVVSQFYQDISDQDYSDAWNLGGDNLSGGVGYNAWVAGYSTTESISLTTESNWGSGEVSGDLSALQSDGSITTYSGTYYVSGGVITSADIQQTS
jgi:hypothetical protein